MPRTVSSYTVKAKGIGLPDYAAPAPLGQVPIGPVHTLTDVGELAARLGSIDTFDRRGNVIWMDDFEAPILKWLTDTVGGGSVPVLSTTQAWMGIQSVYLAVDAAGRSTIFNFFPLVRRGRIGAEFYTYLKGITPGYLSLQLTIYDGTNTTWAELRLDSVARTATIVTPAGDIVVATSVFPLIAYETFVPAKLVVDMDTDRYVRLLIGPDEIDLSAHALNPLGDTTQKLITGLIELVGGTEGIAICHVDEFILTQNEPPNPGG